MFTRSGDPFEVESLPKAFYHPSQAKELTKHDRKICLSGHGNTKDTLQQVSSPEDIKFLKGTNKLKVHEVPTRENGTVADQSSSSQFNESWPSTEQTSSLGTPEGTVSTPEMSQPMREWLEGGEKPQTSSTLAQFINRFRNAPPSSRQHRDRAALSTGHQHEFWWLSPPSGSSTPVDNTPPQKLTLSPRRSPKLPVSHKKREKAASASSSPSSAGVIDSIQRRAKDLLDKSEATLDSTSTEPFPDLMKMKEKKPMTDPYTICPPSRQYIPTRSTTNRPLLHPEKATHHSHPKLNPEDDILYQWRLARKMENAQERALPSTSGVQASMRITPGMGIRAKPMAQVDDVSRMRPLIAGDTSQPALPGHLLPQIDIILSPEATPAVPAPILGGEPVIRMPGTCTSMATITVPGSGPSTVTSTVPVYTPVASTSGLSTLIGQTRPVITPAANVARPCRHSTTDELSMPCHIADVPPHMHFTCDIVPCPHHTGAVVEPTGHYGNQVEKPSKHSVPCGKENQSHPNSRHRPGKSSGKEKQVGAKRIVDLELSGESSFGDKEDDIQREVKVGGTKDRQMERRKRNQQNGYVNKGEKNKTSTLDILGNVIGKVVSEHLFCGDQFTSSSDEDVRSTISQGQDNTSDTTMKTRRTEASEAPSKHLLADSSEEEFADDEILRMLRQKSQSYREKLRCIDNLLCLDS